MSGLTLITACALATACALLSVLVVLRRWAFIGEGIGHAGFGGAGTAWALSLAFPALAGSAQTYVIAVIFCLLTAVAIGYFSRRQRVHVDTAIGIFLVASIAWGFVAQAMYSHLHNGPPPDWHDYLLGRSGGSFSAAHAIAAIAIAAGVVVVLTMLGKEIVSYCFDPAMAEVSGVRVGMIHYLLIVLVALAIVVGMQITGPLLVPALLILPGATALLISRRMRSVLAISVLVGLSGAIGGLLINRGWTFVPQGPAIVLVMFVIFVVAYGVCGRRRAV